MDIIFCSYIYMPQLQIRRQLFSVNIIADVLLIFLSGAEKVRMKLTPNVIKAINNNEHEIYENADIDAFIFL